MVRGWEAALRPQGRDERRVSILHVSLLHVSLRYVSICSVSIPEKKLTECHYLVLSQRLHKRLPHWHIAAGPYFVTWRLHGSLPGHAVANHLATPGEEFLHTDRFLDAAASGPKWLAIPEVAAVVSQILGEYEIGAWVVMPNHVHVIVQPGVSLPQTLAALKARSARDANRPLLG